MLTASLQELRAEAKQKGIPWAHVQAAGRELRRQAILASEPLNRARRVAWEKYCHWTGRTAGCHEFWRCMPRVLGTLADRGYDYTAIPHYDEIASGVAAELPEWEGRGDELWELLASEYSRLPAAAEFLPEALDYVERHRNMEAAPCVSSF